ncbi:hypothetical protein [Bdellovibrio sp. GT3]|uniref:hypothetical protein n=1 Tax=Bdellovibrio sp. GT3 TaxID=3136282 RepID=UPI0030F252B9
MKSSITKFGLTVLVTLLASQSFANGGVDTLENLVGTFKIEGPTNEPGDENLVTFTNEGEVYLLQKSGGTTTRCKGAFEVRNNILNATGTCSHYPQRLSNFAMAIDLSQVTNFGYFQSPVLCKTINVRAADMRFLRVK